MDGLSKKRTTTSSVPITVLERIANPWSLIRLIGSSPIRCVALLLYCFLRTDEIVRGAVKRGIGRDNPLGCAITANCQRVRAVKEAVLKIVCQKWLVGSNPTVGVLHFDN